MKNHAYIIRLTFTALFAAIIMLATMIYIPLGAGGGYLNPGDSMIYAAAWFLGPLAAAAGAIGSALADVILGYAIYAPATFIIKGLMGLVVGLLIKRNGQNFISKIIAMSAGALIMAAGYLIYEYFILQMGVAALANILWNMVQAVAGVIIGTLVVSALGKIKGIQGFVDDLEGK
jgi:uncharacterized membrane protein